ncbi:S9 family peptidase [Asticcacaulis sp.]|uniref:alpha/beta hydrolase family protein n=1 Tax=Asticcacaulis sp. TaxID=1872648 RepID=UPI002B8F3861|nr:S9 family peptidase [Asticcacaulis sp.]HTM81013.1 S9 family peptidase [Asticcacaulis sp.]
MTIAFNRRHLLTAVIAAAFAPKVFAGDAQTPPRPSIEDWAKAPELSHVALSPDGTQIAYIREQEGNKLIYHYDSRTKQFQTFNTGVNPIGIVSWIDNEHLAVSTHYSIAKSSFMGLRNNFFQVSLYNVTQKNLITLFDPMKDTSSERAWWMGSIQRLIINGVPFVQTACLRGEQRMLVRFAMDKQAYDIIDTGGDEIENWVTTPDGALVARAEYYAVKKTWTLSFRRSGLWKEVYSYKGELDSPSLLGLGRDGKTVVVYQEKENDNGQYYEVDSEGNFSAPLDAPGISRSALFDPLTFRLAGFATFDGWFSYHYFDPKRQDLVSKAEKAVEGYRMSIAEQADDPRKMIVYSEGGDDAGTFYLIDFGTGQTMTIGEAYPHIPLEWITSKKPVRYKAADGLEIEAYLTLPPNREAKNLPLVVLPHGGPASRDDLSYDWEVQTYASRGYAVLQPNFRGSSGYGYAFERAGDGQVGRKMQTDLSDGVRYLAAQGLIDPKRVCIIGTSYGGYAAFAGATLDTGVYNCAVSIAGLSDATKWREGERYYLAGVISPAYTYARRLLGDAPKLDDISPIKHVDKVTIPVLIMHGKDDSVVPINQSVDMYKALKAAGKTVIYKEVEHAEHGATTEASRIEMLNTTIAFIEKYNPPA